MREHIYRGKRIDNGEWVEGCYAYYKTKPDMKLIGYNEKWHEVDPETVGEFTGLLNKNCVKIFEGDIAKLPYRNFPPNIVKIVFDRGRFVGITIDGCEDTLMRSDPIEVIGNIFDNPELLLEAK